MLPQNSEFCIVCLGRDTLNLPVGATTQALDTVYNIVVRAPDIVAYRQKVQVGACLARQQPELKRTASLLPHLALHLDTSGCQILQEHQALLSKRQKWPIIMRTANKLPPSRRCMRYLDCTT